jgi:hypothetical protein
MALTAKKLEVSRPIRAETAECCGSSDPQQEKTFRSSTERISVLRLIAQRIIPQGRDGRMLRVISSECRLKPPFSLPEFWWTPSDPQQEISRVSEPEIREECKTFFEDPQVFDRTRQRSSTHRTEIETVPQRTWRFREGHQNLDDEKNLSGFFAVFSRLIPAESKRFRKKPRWWEGSLQPTFGIRRLKEALWR